MQNLHIAFTQRLLVIVGILAAFSLALYIPHAHPAKGRREPGRIELSAASSRDAHDCIWTGHADGAKRAQRSMHVCKRYSAAYSIFDVICPSFDFAVPGIVQAYFLPDRPLLFPQEQQNFLCPS